MRRKLYWVLVLSGFLTTEGRSAHAQQEELCPAAARLVSLQGKIEVRETATAAVRSAVLNDVVCPGASIIVGERSRAAVLLIETETILRLDQATTLQLLESPEAQRSVLDLAEGAIHFLSRVPRSIEVRTPFVNAGIEGTEFVIRVETDRATVTVFEGVVSAANNAGRLELTSGQSAVAEAGAPPTRFEPVIARLRDTVQWAVFYQPIRLGAEIELPSELREVLAASDAGDLERAFQRLDEIEAAGRTDLSFFLVRASLLLAVGRVEDAARDIDAALTIDPSNGQAQALLAIIGVGRAVTAEDVGDALGAAELAVELNPSSSTALLALSYARQASFDLDGARDALLEAVERQPDDALAWARLSELWLSLGNLREALKAAQTADSLAELARTKTVLGFATLAQVKTDDAAAAFDEAIRLDSADPLPRLGLGLAKIRRSDLAEGRLEIEIATSLSPNLALVRSYLGKAYFEEKRDQLSGEQLDLAKRLDENDPTPWLYDAIRKQSENDPIGALRDLQKSKELNNNRAIYRSRQQLDEDLAARGARLGSIYRDLGFEQLALVEGWTSVAIDPSNHSAHRLLADTYSVLPLHEIARDSELLQSQLLQPLNVNPVQPRLAGNGLAFLDDTGPATVGFNEFSRLFASDGVRLQADGIVGGQRTRADNVILSGIQGRASYSLGQFHLSTDGGRENRDLKQNISNAFVQANPSHSVSVQAEYRREDESKGDRAEFFDPEFFFKTSQQDFERDSLRLGGRYSFAPGSVFLGSYVYTDLQDKLDTGTGLDVSVEEDGHFGELQYLRDWEAAHLIAGLGYFNADRSTRVAFGPFPPTESTEKVLHRNGYLYGSYDLWRNFNLTLGVSADYLDDPIVKRKQFNPKVGFIWNVLPMTVVRGAYFQVVKRTLSSSQTIEPTQVAGFNQFFDDPNGTDVRSLGVAIDQQVDVDSRHPGSDLYFGVELSKRDLDVPVVVGGPVVMFSHEERLARAYLYWTPNDWLTGSASYRFERFVDDPLALSSGRALAESKTHKLPFEVRIFRPSGFFGRLRATYVSQEGRFQNAAGTVVPGSDRFWVADALVGYRFPRRRGVATLEVRNLLDEDFRFQDTDPENSAISRERQILLRLTFSF